MEEVKAQVNKTHSLILALAQHSNQIVVPTNTSNVQPTNGLSWEAGKAGSMMMMFIGTETLVTQLVHEISRMQAC
jgi:hypothetical protein